MKEGSLFCFVVMRSNEPSGYFRSSCSWCLWKALDHVLDVFGNLWMRRGAWVLDVFGKLLMRSGAWAWFHDVCLDLPCKSSLNIE
jgi:hypothetical protein